MRSLMLVMLLLPALATTTAAADPGVSVDYRDDILRVTLDGSYGGAYYQVWRSGQEAGGYDAILAQPSLCTGECFVTDAQVTPGATYYYRFDVWTGAGSPAAFGPYAVTIPDTPIAARVRPNPSDSDVSVELALPGSRRNDAPLAAEARVLDLQGRTVRVVFSGRLGRGTTAVTWDGRDSRGRSLGAGIYFLRLTTPIGATTTRIVRFR